MKRLLAIITIAAFTACGGGSNDPSTSNESPDTGTMSSKAATSEPDSIKRASDSTMQTGDTSALNRKMGDTTSTSGSHGQGSGSGVGGGKKGGAQGRKGHK